MAKYAGNTFILPDQDYPDGDGGSDGNQGGHKTYFIPKSVSKVADRKRLLKASDHGD